MNEVKAKIVGLCIFSFLVLCLSYSCKKEVNNFRTEEQFVSIAKYISSDTTKFNIFFKMIKEGKLLDALSSYNPNGKSYTLFLPTDSAFYAYIKQNNNYSNITQLLTDNDFINVLVRYHVVNSEFRTNDFPFGALPDTTLSGDKLTIGFSNDLDTTIYKVNNVAPIINANIEASNGYIHIISKVLEPIVFSSYDLMKFNPDYSIITKALDTTGLKDKMGFYTTNDNGNIIKNIYTMLVEPDSIYHKSGIYSIEDLISHVKPINGNYSSEDNSLYQFTAYHILDGSYFLDNFENSVNYNTWASLPVRVDASFIIKINQGVANFGTIISGEDTSIINYIEPNYNESNILSKNGPIHIISEVMNLYKPARSERIYEFYEEPLIYNVKNVVNTYQFTMNKFTALTWQGVNEIKYIKSSSNAEMSTNKDYIQINGDFSISYNISKLLPGRYSVKLMANAFSQQNAIIQIFIDDHRVGGNVNLTSGGSSKNPYYEFVLGEYEFSTYTTHIIRIQSLIPGNFIWDYIKFTPV
ncbi:MAG: fasciclin domain-containing protein [Bacteroidia bacterium]|nr:fasciclin domain-containing protein [Bacteroidia bacterium]